jgi:head-tail adaptor
MDNPFIGQMDRKIQLVQKVKTQTSTGSEVSSEAVMASPFAYMKDMSGGEEVDGKVKHLVSRTYTIRFNQEIKTIGTALMLIDEARKFEILHIIEIGRKKHLEIRCKSYE